jgi:hypothetical protein
VSFSSPGSPFGLTSLWLTPGWNNGLNVAINGWLNGIVTHSTTVTLTGPSTAQQIALNWNNIDMVELTPFGGSNAGVGGSGDHLVLDDIGTSVTPEPATFVLMGSGLLAFVGVARRRRRAA